MIKVCLNCNKELPKKKHKFCTNKCRHSYNSRKNNPNIKYWKYILNYITTENITHFSIRQISLNYFELKHGNNLKYHIRKEILSKYILKFKGLISTLKRNNIVKLYNNNNQNKRYLIDTNLIKIIKQIINGNYVFNKNEIKNRCIYENVEWIPFNKLTTHSLYFLCKLDNKPIDSIFRKIWNK